MMALMDPVAVLAESTLFKAVPPAELEALASAATSRTFKKGNYIFRQGDLGKIGGFGGHMLFLEASPGLLTARSRSVARLILQPGGAGQARPSWAPLLTAIPSASMRQMRGHRRS